MQQQGHHQQQNQQQLMASAQTASAVADMLRLPSTQQALPLPQSFIFF
jgi:hypothetical protein